MGEEIMTQPSPEQVVQAVYTEAAQLMRSGMSDYQVEQALIAKGVPAEAARTVVSRLSSARSEAYRGEAYKQMAIGAVIAIIGIVVTWVRIVQPAAIPMAGHMLSRGVRLSLAAGASFVA